MLLQPSPHWEDALMSQGQLHGHRLRMLQGCR